MHYANKNPVYWRAGYEWRHMKMKNIVVLGSILTVILLSSFSGCVERGENILGNSGFEFGSSEGPSNWFKAISPNEDLTMIWDSTVFYNGSYSASIHNNHIYEETVHNNWYQGIEEIPKGRLLELNGWIKTLDAESVSMMIECIDEEYNQIGFASTITSYGIINGTTEWTNYNTNIFVPLSTVKIGVRLILTGTGQVWFDDVELIVKV
jgi:hypothetical protein